MAINVDPLPPRANESESKPSNAPAPAGRSRKRTALRQPRRGDCTMLSRLGIRTGDAPPLHSTIHYDGYRHDHGIHARVEGAVDDRVSWLQAAAAPMVKVKSITSVWPMAIDEIRNAHSYVDEIIEADRKARRVAHKGPRYTGLLFAQAGPMLTGQIAAAASALASIWLYEWKNAGSPNRCASSKRTIATASTRALSLQLNCRNAGYGLLE